MENKDFFVDKGLFEVLPLLRAWRISRGINRMRQVRLARIPTLGLNASAGEPDGFLKVWTLDPAID
jgi:hypothetical protein